MHTGSTCILVSMVTTAVPWALIMLLNQPATSMTQSISLCLTVDSNKPNSTCDRCVAPLTPCRSNTSREHSFSCNFCTWPRPDAFFVRKVLEWSGAGVVTLAAEVDTDIICRHTQSTLQMLTLPVTFLATDYILAALLEKVKAPQLLKKSSAFYGPQRFITMFTKGSHFFFIMWQINRSRHRILLLSRFSRMCPHLCSGLPEASRFQFSPSKTCKHFSPNHTKHNLFPNSI